MLDYFRSEMACMDTDTAALDQPGDEGRAYGRHHANWQRVNRGTGYGDEISDAVIVQTGTGRK
jgi:hypothetical protein